MRELNAVLLISLIFGMTALLKVFSYRKNKNVDIICILMVVFAMSLLSYGVGSNYVGENGNLYWFAWTAITCMSFTFSKILIGVALRLEKLLNI